MESYRLRTKGAVLLSLSEATSAVIAYYSYNNDDEHNFSCKLQLPPEMQRWPGLRIDVRFVAAKEIPAR